MKRKQKKMLRRLLTLPSNSNLTLVDPIDLKKRVRYAHDASYRTFFVCRRAILCVKACNSRLQEWRKAYIIILCVPL